MKHLQPKFELDQTYFLSLVNPKPWLRKISGLHYTHIRNSAFEGNESLPLCYTGNKTRTSWYAVILPSSLNILISPVLCVHLYDYMHHTHWEVRIINKKAQMGITHNKPVGVNTNHWLLEAPKRAVVQNKQHQLEDWRSLWAYVGGLKKQAQSNKATNTLFLLSRMHCRFKQCIQDFRFIIGLHSICA